MAKALIFPGQGSQAVGMGKALAEGSATARAVFDEIDEALGDRLSAIMWDGPEDALTLTENAQPALMAVSLAVMRTLEQDFSVDVAKAATFVAGHSLGEYSALAAAHAIGIADAARLLRTRGQAMQSAVPVGEGAMAAMLGISMEDAQRLAEAAGDAGVCQVANDNAPGQVVLSGAKAGVDKAVELAKEYGAKRAIPLNVSAPFHCALMAPAADVMAEALGGVEISTPKVPVVANVLAEPVSDPDDIRKRLVEQVTGTVRWRECVGTMAGEGVDTFYEIGSGKVLCGLVRQIDRALTSKPVGTMEDIEAVAAELSE
ncbi:MAG: ACP S-malonyltransferase [Hyphomicrobiaceae bacterium]